MLEENGRECADLAEYARDVAIEGTAMDAGTACVREGREYDVRITFAEASLLRLLEEDLILRLPACLVVTDEQPHLAEPIEVHREGEDARREGFQVDGASATIEDGTLRLKWAGACGKGLERLRALDSGEFDILIRGSFVPGTEFISFGSVGLPLRVEPAGPTATDKHITVADVELTSNNQSPDDHESVG